MTALAVTTARAKSFGGLRVTAQCRASPSSPGERRLIIGPNGAGKTTLFNLITGETRPRQRHNQRCSAATSRARACRRRAHLGMARTYQIITLFARDTILRNVTLALPRPVAIALECAVVDLDSAALTLTEARAALARVGLVHIAERPLARDLLWRAPTRRDRHGAGAEPQGPAA